MIDFITNDLWDNTEIHVWPQLPTVEFRKGKDKYRVSDLRLLHPYGVMALKICFKQMLQEYTDEIALQAPFQLTDDEFEIVRNILFGFEISWKRRGRVSSDGTLSFFNRIRRDEHDDGTVLRITPTDEIRHAVYNFGKTMQGDVPIDEFAVNVINHYLEYIDTLRERCADHGKNDDAGNV